MATSISRRSSFRSIITATLLGTALWSGHSHGVTRDTAISPADLVKEALHREIYGLPAERERLLSDAARKDEDYGPAQWHRGFIKTDGEWADIESLISETASEAVKEYESLREKSTDTVVDQLLLANWCRDKQLRLQEQAHLTRVLDLNPDHQMARERLGYRRISGRWLTATEIATSFGRQKEQNDAAKRWRTELQEIERDLHHPNATRRDAARARLAAINEVNAIPTMESIISVPSQEGALAVVDALGKLKGQDAVESLVRHAVFSQWPLVRQAAAERLKERRLSSFVPSMLREMYTPLVSRYDITQRNDGTIVYTHAFIREGQEEQQVMRLDTAYRRIAMANGDSEDSLIRAFESSFSGLANREREAARQNAIQLTYNQRIVEALRLATYQDLAADPKLWWQWWDKENDVVRLTEKQTNSQYRLDQVAIVDRPEYRATSSTPRTPFTRRERTATPNSSRGMSIAGGRVRRSGECFVAGTPVWTRYGKQPIESLRIGDLVLAQDVESGEIAFKPVLGRTLRPAEEIVKVRVGKDVLECTHGHLFWVAGHGWAKADRLDSGAALHGLRGSLPVSYIETGLKIETHNLVVADYHTYFVGNERVLSHDVTQSAPTDVVVPGLQDD